jgi:AraC-like DNA-binding protein
MLKKKYEKSRLQKEEAKKYVELLNNYMEKEKPYLNPDLSLNDLVKTLGIKRNILTQVLNMELNKKFFLYINEFRIRDALKILNDPSKEKMNILNIAYATGFNSKPTFNRAFKKITGHTPSEYKKNVSS